jgi:hypothetical protein
VGSACGVLLLLLDVSVAVTQQWQLRANVVPTAVQYKAAETTGIKSPNVVPGAENIAPPSQSALAGQAGTAQGSTTAFSPPPPPAVPRKLADYQPTTAMSPSGVVSGMAFGTHHKADKTNSGSPHKWLCDPGQGYGPNNGPLTTSNCGRTGTLGARGGQAGMEYGQTAENGALHCVPMKYLHAFPPPRCEDTPAFITASNTHAHQAGWKGSTIAAPAAIATAHTKGGPNPWQVPMLAPPPPPQEALVNSQTSGIAPAGSCNVGPSGHSDVTSGFVVQDFQLPLTCHSNQEVSSAGWKISGGAAATSATLKNYHWHSHNTFTPGVSAYANRQWHHSPCVQPVYKTAYCMAPDRVVLGGSTGQIPGELAVPGAAVDASLVAPVLAAGGR